jgi:hypothetical protein
LHYKCTLYLVSHDSLYCAAMGCGLWAVGWIAGVSCLVGQEDSSLLFSVETQHPIHGVLGAGFPGRIRLPLCELGHSFPTDAEFKSGGVMHPLPNVLSWCDAELVEHRDNFTYRLYLTAKEWWNHTYCHMIVTAQHIHVGNGQYWAISTFSKVLQQFPSICSHSQSVS